MNDSKVTLEYKIEQRMRRSNIMQASGTALMTGGFILSLTGFLSSNPINGWAGLVMTAIGLLVISKAAAVQRAPLDVGDKKTYTVS